MNGNVSGQSRVVVVSSPGLAPRGDGWAGSAFSTSGDAAWPTGLGNQDLFRVAISEAAQVAGVDPLKEPLDGDAVA
jgi:hypothetical protein